MDRKQAALALDLLTGVLRVRPDLSALTDPCAWRIIKDNAVRHGVAPLIAYTARSHVSGCERQWCDRMLTRSWQLHERNRRALNFLLGRLSRTGIRVLVLKGPWLAMKYYTPPFLRKPSSDLDLAVAESNVDEVCRSLVLEGYAVQTPYSAVRYRSHHVELVHPELPKVELHFRLSHGASGIPVSEAMNWAVPGPQAVPGAQNALVLDAPGEFLHLLLHRAWGRYATLFHLYEIARIGNDLSVEAMKEVIRRAGLFGFGGVLSLTDVALRVRFGSGLPEGAEQGSRPWLGSRITEEFYRKFEELSDPQRTLPATVRLRRRLLDLQLTQDWRQAVRFGSAISRIALEQILSGNWRTFQPTWASQDKSGG